MTKRDPMTDDDLRLINTLAHAQLSDTMKFARANGLESGPTGPLVEVIEVTYSHMAQAVLRVDDADDLADGDMGRLCDAIADCVNGVTAKAHVLDPDKMRAVLEAMVGAMRSGGGDGEEVQA